MGELKDKVLNLISGGGAVAEVVPVQPDHALAPDAARIGVMLRATRVQAGLELRDVATMLKIRHAFMEAIEDGRYHELPGTAYAVGFVRTYADYLGLDGDLAVRRFKDEVAGKVGQQSLYFPTPVPEGRVPGGAVLLVSLLLAAVIYGGWYVLSASDRSLVDVVPTLPQRLVSLLGSFGSHPAAVSPPPAGSASAPEVTPQLPPPPAPAPASVADAPPPVTGPLTAPAVSPAMPPAPAASVPASPTVAAPATAAAPAAAASDADAGDEIPLVSGPSDENSGGPGPLVPMAPRVKPTPPAPADATATPQAPADATAAAPAGAVPAPAPVAAAPAPAAPPPVAASAAPPPSAPVRTFGAQASESRVQIKATQDTWVQVREGSGEVIFSKVLHTGDVYRVPNHPGTRLRTGNAGGLQMIVDNGEPVVLGGVGEVVRDIPVDGSSVKRR